MRAICSLLIAVFLVGCGGSGTTWDEYQPRPATVSEISAMSFRFSWFPTGNPVDPDVTTYRLEFGTLSAEGAGSASLVEEDGGTALVSVDFDAAAGTLELEVQSTTGAIGVEVGQVTRVLITADESDGRIRLESLDRSSSSASDR